MLGVAEVSDATPLDRLGLPVFFSARPHGTTRRLHSGKGMNIDDAHVGALMEAVELATAESASFLSVDGWLPLEQLLAQLPHGLSLADFAPRVGNRAAPDSRIPVVRCEELTSGSRTLLPADLVLVPCPPYDPASVFGWSTNGLASGNSLQEATLHALLEVAERDTVAMNLARDESFLVGHPALPTRFRTMASEWHAVGIELIVRYLPNDFGLPCFEAGFHEPVNRQAALVCGWGLHLDSEIALSRAVCEAAQARLVAMQESRRDLPGLANQHKPTLSARRDQQRDILARLTNEARRIDFSEVPTERCTSVSSALKTVLSRLATAGLGPVFRRRMHFAGDPHALLGLHVVKVVVPRSESIVDAQARMGPRLLKRVLGAPRHDESAAPADSLSRRRTAPRKREHVVG